MKNDKLIKLFLDLVKIPSPSGKEVGIAQFIQSFLQREGITNHIDSAGSKNESNTGNVIAYLPGSKGMPTVLFLAHMDTVETGEKAVSPQVKNGIITSDKTTILGADDKAGVAVLLCILTEFKSIKKKPNIYAVFTTREEKGKMGIRFADLPKKVDYAFNLDAQGPLGKFTNKALGQVPFVINIKGKSAHAALEPEKGINAISAASLFISQLQQGRKKDGTTLNIGTIQGGSGINVVPEKVEILGEVRGYTEKSINKRIKEVEKALKIVSKQTRILYSFFEDRENGAPPMDCSVDKKIADISKKACKESGLKFVLGEQKGTTEGNFLAEKGFSVLNVCRGGAMAHSTEESITVKELNQFEKLVGLIIKSVR